MQKLVIKIVISSALLFFFLRDSHLGEITSAVTSYSLVILGAVFSLYVAAMLVSAVKWKLLLPEYSFGKLLRFTFIGQFYSLVLPGQLLGEAAKAYRMGKGEINADKIAVSVFIDKLTGIAGLFLVGFFGALLSGTNISSGILWIMGVGFLAVVGVLILARLNVLGGIFSRLLPPVRRLFGVGEDSGNFLLPAAEHFHEYARKNIVITASVFLGVVFQLLAVGIVALFAQSLGIPISFQDLLWIFGVVSIAVLLPVTIAGLGIREGTFIGILSWFSVVPELALALSFSVFSLQVFAAAIGGLIELRSLTKKGKQWSRL